MTVARPVLRAAVSGDRMAFTGRAEGNVSLVVGAEDPALARATLAALVDLEVSDLIFMEQVHGRDVARVGTQERGRGVSDHAASIRGVDALVTTDPDVGLVVLTADCVPVLIAAEDLGVAAVHAGRRGLGQGIVRAAVQALADATGLAPPDMRAVLGPAIGGCCYEVPEAMAAAIAERVPASRCRTRSGAAGLDLPAGVISELAGAGLERIEAVGSCTRCHAHEWFSHRATAHGAEPGRQGSVIRLTEGGRTW